MKFREINNIISKIQIDMKAKDSLWNTNRNEYINNIKKDHLELVNTYNSIFNIVFNVNFSSDDMERLTYMIKMAEKVQSKSITEHDASVKVGQRLVDDIVKPQLNN